jgi:hypothetical protein
MLQCYYRTHNFKTPVSTVSSSTWQAEEVDAVASNAALLNLAEPNVIQQMHASNENAVATVCSNDTIELAEMKNNTSSVSKRRKQTKGIKRPRSKSALRQSIEPTEHNNVPKRSTRDGKLKRYDDYDNGNEIFHNKQIKHCSGLKFQISSVKI